MPSSANSYYPYRAQAFIPYVVLDGCEEAQDPVVYQHAPPRNSVFVCPRCGRTWGRIHFIGALGQVDRWEAHAAVCDDHDEMMAGSLLQWPCRWAVSGRPEEQTFGPKLALRELKLVWQQEEQRDAA